jgi:ornithine decarboxylase
MNTPYFTISASAVVEQYNEIASFADEVNYSAKTNYDLIPVLEDRTDAGFSIHFDHAVPRVNDPSRITYFLQGITPTRLNQLVDNGITTFVIDNPSDLNIFMDWDAPREITVYLRLRRRENTVKTGKHYVFGMQSTTVNDAVTQLADKDNVGSVGVHVHRKTQNVAEWRLRDELSDTVTDDALEVIDAVNAGGGFPVQYHNYQRDTLSSIKQRFDDLHEWTNNHDVTLVIEPGRIIAAPPGELHTTIINVYNDTVVVDASVYNAAMDTFVANTRLQIREETDDGDPYTVKGRTPDSLDILRYKARLDNPERGDTLTFENATAYNYSSDFCDLPRPTTELTE